MSRFIQFIRLVRPLNIVICAVTVLLGIWLASGKIFTDNWYIILVSVVLVFAGGNAINDYYDAETDRINKPDRPVPRGDITKKGAVNLSVFLFAAGSAAGMFIGSGCFIICVMCSLGLWVYSGFLKKTPFWGNLTVALLSGMTFLYCGTAVSGISGVIVPALFAFLFHLGREIVKDLEDVPGDRERNCRTIPIRYGESLTKAVITGVFVLLIVTTLYPYFFLHYRIFYFLTVVIGVDLFLLYVLWTMWRTENRTVYGRLSVFLKYDIFIGLLSLIFR